jgi:peroxiredoxin
MQMPHSWSIGARAFVVVAAIGLAAGLAYALWSRPPAPEVAFITLNGEKLTTRDLNGKVVYVNFWATDCPGCIKEMPDLIKTYDTYHARGFEVLAVAMQYDPPDYVRNYTEKNRLPFKVVLDTHGQIAQAFGGIMLTPTAFLIDRHGKIVKRLLGEPEFAALRAAVERELAG